MIGNLLAWLADPNVAYLLFVLGLLGIIGELVTAGTIVPGTLGAISLILALVGLGHLPTNWGGAALIVLAVALFLADLHVPGHALSVGGVLVFVLGSVLLFTPFWVAEAPGEARLSPWVTASTTVGVTLFFTLGVAAAWRSRHAPLAVGRETIVGKTGVVRRALDPQGIVHVEGEEWTAEAANGATLAVGTPVRVVGVSGLTLRVEPIPEDVRLLA